jgi:hypothetical protein
MTMIPTVKQISLDGGGLSDIDYSPALSTENGLVRPFCLTSADVLLGILAPEDLNGNKVGISKLGKIEVMFDFYSYSGGKEVALFPKLTEYPSAFRTKKEDTLSSGITRVWDPVTQTVTFSAATEPVTTYNIELWNEILLSKAASKSVKIIRARITFKSTESALQSGTAVWFKKGC